MVPLGNNLSRLGVPVGLFPGRLAPTVGRRGITALPPEPEQTASVDQILNALAETGGASLTGPELQRETGLLPADIDNAVSLLELVELVRCTYLQGSAPFSFTSAELSDLAKLQHERLVGLTNEEQFKAIRQEMQGIWSRSGQDPFPRFCKIIRASSLSASQVSELLDLVPPLGPGTTGANCKRLYGILSRTCEERRENEKNAKTVQDPDRVQSFRRRIRQHPIGAVIILVSVFLAAVASFTSSIDTIVSFVQENFGAGAAATELPGDTGWIFAGYFDIDREVFIEGPYVSVVRSASSGHRRYVDLGDTIRLNVARPVIIVDFKRSGTAKKLVSPIEKGIVDEFDETNVFLSADTELVVRDISEGRWLSNPNAALWLRVVHAPR